ncbi:MAG: hypothetical protein QNJ09_09450 [Paracoccaceae bacterium]|nr:hypothetical protein [Paracoccaceae bacterium]
MSGLLAPDDLPPADRLQDLFRAGLTGDGTPWLARREVAALARMARDRGVGISLMEAGTVPLHEPVGDSGWEILGADPAGWNWAEHHDPARAYELFCRKLNAAARAGVTLHYRLWLARSDG